MNMKLAVTATAGGSGRTGSYHRETPPLDLDREGSADAEDSARAESLQARPALVGDSGPRLLLGGERLR